MKTNMMLSLVAISLLASCGQIKTPPISLQDTKATVTPGSGVGGGALGIDGGKGAPLSLSRGGLTVQGVNPVTQVASGSFADLTQPDLLNNLSKLAEWGATQNMPTATLSGTACPASFNVTDISFTVKVTDPANTTGVSKTVVIPQIGLAATAAGSCEYNASIGAAVAAVNVSISGADLTTFGTIITSGGLNTVTLNAGYTTNDPAVTGRTLVVNFGGSSSYIIANII
jgi:hypothetical protein